MALRRDWLLIWVDQVPSALDHLIHYPAQHSRISPT